MNEETIRTLPKKHPNTIYDYNEINKRDENLTRAIAEDASAPEYLDKSEYKEEAEREEKNKNFFKPAENNQYHDVSEDLAKDIEAANERYEFYDMMEEAHEAGIM